VADDPDGLLGWTCVAGGFLSAAGCFGDWAKAVVAIARPIAVVVISRIFMWSSSSRCGYRTNNEAAQGVFLKARGSRERSGEPSSPFFFRLSVGWPKTFGLVNERD